MRIFSALFLASTAAALVIETEPEPSPGDVEMEPRSGGELFTFPNKLMRSMEMCCQDPNYISCTEITLNFEDFDTEEMKKISVNGINLEFASLVPPTGFVYRNEQGDEAVFSYNKINGHLFGDISTHDGKTFEIESCHHGHVIKEVDVSHLKNDYVTVPDSVLANVSSRADHPVDRNTIVTFSVMFYYTAEFEAITADIQGFIAQVIDITNQGFINSNIPVRATAFCIEKATISDAQADMNLDALKYMKGSPEATLNSADAATLLVAHSNHYCGVAWLHPAYKEWSFSNNVKSCVSTYVVAHELGHNFGCHHDLESTGGQNWVDSAGFGHFIEGGARTIMAYYKRGYSKVNYFSNPDVSYQGQPTGVAGVTNNAAVITKYRSDMADNGDESRQCDSQTTNQGLREY